MFTETITIKNLTVNVFGTFILEHVGEIMVDIYECNYYCRCPPFISLTCSKIKAPRFLIVYIMKYLCALLRKLGTYFRTCE